MVNVCTVANATDLVNALTTIDNNPGTYTVNITADITLTSGTTLPAITGSANNVTINGNNHTLDGGSIQRGFFVYQGTVAINDLTIQNAKASGGAGGSGGVGGGGGMGAGGALFVAATAQVTVSNVTLTGDRATGGAGGTGNLTNVKAGGGGMGGNGGAGTTTTNGGGGGLGLGANGGTGTVTAAGGAGIAIGQLPGGTGDHGGAGGANGGGGGAGGPVGGSSIGLGGGGGIGGNNGSAAPATGGFGGGGGATSGPGGFGGGGSGTGFNDASGGFGGGGGGSVIAGPFSGGFGGGSGGSGSGNGGGGGGAGMGGAIFVQQGGSLTLAGPLNVDGNQVSAGSGRNGGTNGSAFGSGLFLQGNGTVAFSPGTNQTQTVSDVIADQTGSGGTGANAGSWTLSKTGTGTLVLDATNTYSGGTNVTGGTLSISSDANLGNGGTVALSAGTALDFTASGSYSHAITVAGDPAFDVGSGLTVAQTVAIGNGATAGMVEKTGAGTLVLGATNSYTGGTTVTGGTLSISSSGNLGNGGTLALEDGTTLDYSAGGSYSGHPITVAGDSTFNVGSGLTVKENDQITDGATPGIVDKTGAGTLVLGGMDTYSGGTTIAGGTVQLANGMALGPGGVDMTASGTKLDFNSFSQTIGHLAGVTGSQVILDTATLTTGGDGTSTAFTGDITGAGQLIKEGGGTFTLGDFNTYSGNTTVKGGTLGISSSDSLGAAGTLVLEDGTTLAYNAGGQYIGHPITVAGDPAFSVGSGLTVTENDKISDGASAGTVEVTGGGTLVLTNTTNSYSGGTTVSGNSTLRINDDKELGNTSGGVGLGDATSGGTLATTAGVTSARGVTLGALGGTVNVAGGTTTTLSGTISGAGLTKSGAGTLVLSGNSNYTGNTTVTAGALSISSDANLGIGGTLALEDGTTVNFAGNPTSYSHAITVSGAANFNEAPGALNATITGLISDGASAGKVQATGGGVFQLSNAANSYSGGTTVTGGTTLVISNDHQLGDPSSGVTLGDASSAGILQFTAASSGRNITLGAGGGTIVSNPFGTTTLQGDITGSGSLTKRGPGTLILTGTNDYSGGTSVNGGTLQGNTASLQGDISIAVNSTLNFNQGSAGTYGGKLSGGGRLLKNGSGTLTLSGSSDGFTGNTSVDAGTISISADDNLGVGGTLQLANGTGIVFTAGGTYTHPITVAGDPFFTVGPGQTVSQTGPITDGASAGTVEVTGGGTLQLTDTTNSYSGGTTVTGNSIVGITDDKELGNASGGLTLGDGTSGGTLATTASVTSARGVTLGAGGGTVDVAGGAATTLSGLVSGGGALTKSGTGTLTLSGNNTGYTGNTTVTAGTLSISSSANLGTGGTLALENGTVLDYGAGGTYSGHPITVAGDPSFHVGSGLSVTENDQITDGATPGTVEVTGGGTLALTNTGNSYSGGTTVSGNSTLAFTSDHELGDLSGGLTLGEATTGGTLSTPNGVVSGRSITLDAGGGTVDVSASQLAALQGKITGDGGLTKTGLGTLVLTGNNDYGGGTTVSAGTLQGNTTSLQGEITDNATLVFDQGSTGTYGGKLSGSGSLVKSGTGTLIISGINLGFSGNTTVSGGTLSISSTFNLGTGTTLALEDGTTLNYGAAGVYGSNTHTITVAGDPSFNVGSGLLVTEGSQITDGATPGTVEVTGGGKLQLTNLNNSYSGGTTVTGNSTLLVETDSHMGAAGGGLTLGDATSGGTLETPHSFTSARNVTLGAGGGTFQVDNSPSTTTLTLQGVISGDGGLSKSGDGTLVLSGDNGYAGNTTVSAGTLSISDSTNLGIGGTLALENGTTLDYGAEGDYGGHAITVAGDPSFHVGSGLFVSEAGQISDGTSAGTVEVAGGGALLLDNTANSYSGGTVVTGNSRLFVTDDRELGNATGGLTLGDATSGGTLFARASITSDRGITLEAGGGTIGIFRNDTATLQGKITGSGGLTVDAATGMVILTGNNDYTGNTIVTSGTLSISADDNLGNGGTLELGNGTGVDFTAGGTYTHPVTVAGIRHSM